METTERNLLLALDLASNNIKYQIGYQNRNNIKFTDIEVCSICLKKLLEGKIFKVFEEGKGFEDLKKIKVISVHSDSSLHKHHQGCVEASINNGHLTCPDCRGEIDNKELVELIQKVKATQQELRLNTLGPNALNDLPDSSGFLSHAIRVDGLALQYALGIRQNGL